ncbi:hypothetical protein FE840_003080 [Peteryoungia desertarenae]|uniref:Anti-sigma factor NepR domain-containing protein n=1 Tax=Peteryoungia desertarenae TaxID=1813451 RepID=A0ABX6QK01_9HYPH|nr:hypothetical protein [Peteryoungia desertarenae]QLF68612.1 hypothetical protein FE840_003080 [Peteryoungia desertarenae]
MAQKTKTDPDSSRARKDDVVHQKLNILMSELKREDVPPHLHDLALQLQDALNERQD